MKKHSYLLLSQCSMPHLTLGPNRHSLSIRRGWQIYTLLHNGSGHILYARYSNLPCLSALENSSPLGTYHDTPNPPTLDSCTLTQEINTLIKLSLNDEPVEQWLPDLRINSKQLDLQQILNMDELSRIEIHYQHKHHEILLNVNQMHF